MALRGAGLSYGDYINLRLCRQEFRLVFYDAEAIRRLSLLGLVEEYCDSELAGSERLRLTNKGESVLELTDVRSTLGERERA